MRSAMSDEVRGFKRTLRTRCRELMNMQLGCAMPQHLTTFAAQRTAAVNSLTVTFLRRSQHGKRNYKLEKAMAKSETKTH